MNMPSEDPNDKLANGLLELHEPGLRILQKQLSELTNKQETIVQKITKENEKFHNIHLNETAALFSLVKDYHLRLMTVKQKMAALSERSEKMKKRAMKLQEYKQKEVTENARLRESQLRREEELIAPPATNINPIQK